MSDIRDVIVIGSGPAGLAAATEAGKAGLTCLTVDPQGPGGQLINLGVLHDFPDAPEGTTGPELLGTLVDRATEAGVEIGFGEVKRLSPAEGGLWLVESDEETWLARAVVVATGLTKGTTGLDDEAAFEGRGISHCAVCDGPLYKNKPVAIYGDSRWAAVEARELAEYASAVTVIGSEHDDRVAGLPGALPHVSLLQGRVIALRGGDSGLTSLAVAQEANTRIEVLTQGLFVLAGRQPATRAVVDAVRTSGSGHIAVDGDLAASAPGVFACGDVTGAEDRLAEAIANGASAGQNATRWVTGRTDA